MFTIFWIGPLQYKSLVACIDLNCPEHKCGGKELQNTPIATKEQIQVVKLPCFRHEPYKETQATEGYLRMPLQASSFPFLLYHWNDQHIK